MEQEENNNHANEPQADYSKRVILTTLAELEERDREFTRKMTHEQRMEYLQKLIHITHGSDLSVKERKFYTGKINIKKTE